MRMPFPSIDRKLAVVGTLCMAISAVLAGCASKNPLIDEPAPPAASVAKPAEQRPPEQIAAKPGDTQAANSAVTTTGPTGIRRVLGAFSPYRIDIQQGNFVSREMVAQLKEGMTREQVRFVLGTPLLADMFHADRWDYVFRLQKSTGEVISSRVAVFFNNNLLSKVDSGVLPTEQEYLAFIAGTGANK